MIYEYECLSCGVIEVQQKMSDAPLAHCPTCEQRGATSPVKKLISASSFILKGGGWAADNYHSKN